MKVSDIASIPDPYQRFIQSSKFLRSLKDAESKAAEIRDRALLELRNPKNKNRPTQTTLANEIGVAPQRVSSIEAQARERYRR